MPSPSPTHPYYGSESQEALLHYPESIGGSSNSLIGQAEDPLSLHPGVLIAQPTALERLPPPDITDPSSSTEPQQTLSVFRRMYTWCQDKLDSATGNTEYRGIQRAEYNRLVKERYARLERDKPKKNAIKAAPDASTSFGLPYVDLTDEEYAKVLQVAEKDFMKRAWKKAGEKADEARREDKKAKRVVGNI